MPNTFELIASSTVGSGGAASIDFTSIPSTYTDLKVVFSLRNTANSADTSVQFNGSTTGLSDKWLYGDGSSAASFSNSTIGAVVARSSYTASTFGNGELYIPNYNSSNNKSVAIDSVAENNSTATAMNLEAGLWSNTAAITSIKLIPGGSSTFVQYSTAYLYGISKS